MKVLIFSALFCVQFVKCANILGLFAWPAYSHYSLGVCILDELLDRGHNVTMLSAYRSNKKHDNYTEIYVDGLYDMEEENKKKYYDFENISSMSETYGIYRLGYFYVDFTLKSASVQAFLKTDSKFDVIIMDQFQNEAFLGFSHHFKVPMIYVSSMGPSPWINHLVGNPAPLSYVPSIFTKTTSDMNFYQRMNNVKANLFEELYRRLIAFPEHNRILQTYFPNAPHLYELMYADPLILVNSHYSTNEPVPHVGSMIQIGGFHVKPKPLPTHLQHYLDDSKQGVIFFSMGSNLKTKDLPPKKRNAILNAFGQLKVNVLWKWEDEIMVHQPKNVKIEKWVPQQAILAHPNVKGFVTHGGLLSTIESVYFGVPIIGIPIFGDQKMNIRLAQERGYAIKLNFQELDEEVLSWALDQILHNKSYSENVKKRSQLMNDRLMKPIDQAVYWVEHVIRYKGVKHLRNASLNLSWYQYHMLDVVAVILFALYAMYKVLRIILSMCLGGKGTKIKTN